MKDLSKYKINTQVLKQDLFDLLPITLGIMIYTFSWSAFLLPYQITSGGVAGISALIFYGAAIPVQYSNFVINAILMLFAFRILGPRFSLKTLYAIFAMTFFLWFFQYVVDTYIPSKETVIINNMVKPLILGRGQDFMACIIGAALCGAGLGIVFNSNGSTGGTDIIAAVVNKYKDISLGKMIMICDVFIIGSSYFVFKGDVSRVIFGFVTLFILGIVLDWIVNSNRQSVQFLIFSKKYDEISDAITSKTGRGVTVLDGTGWYSKNNVKVLVVLAKKRQSNDIFGLIKTIDPNAFISQSSVIGVYGEGFDKLKGK
ncbi:MAG: YitT family protein [Bacteroides sp.]|nr:YitT family protein [Bacteroides sp.]